MRVLLAGQTFGPRNGPGVFTRSLARGLAASGHDVTVAVPAARLRSSCGHDGEVNVEEIRGITLAPFHPEVAVTVAARRVVARLISVVRPDVIHLQDHYPLARAVRDAASAAGIPLVATNHFVPQNMTAQMRFGRIAGLQRAFERWAWRGLAGMLNAMSIVAAPTPTAAAMLARHGVTAPLRAISCGVDTARFAPADGVDRAALRRRWGIAPRDVVAIYVGRLDRDKRVATLVDAVSRDSARAVQLVIAGRGREERALRLASARRAPQRIVFTGFVADEDLPDLLRCADFFAIAGDAELQSIATLEAMACGLPVVAADAMALPELVTPGVNGELFRAGDAGDAARAMAAVAARREGWNTMSRASRARAERHDVRLTVAAYERLYADACR